MQKTLLIHNPRCSKSREAKKILEELSIDFITIDYLRDGLKEKLLLRLPELLNCTYEEMVRTKEELYKELKLADKKLSSKEWIAILMKNPVLLERPIFINGSRALVARPPELVKEIL